MKIINLSAAFLVLFTGISLISCIKKPVYPSEPVIAYDNFIRYGDPANPDSVEVVISFTDNEGDIGLTQADTFGIFKKGNVCLYESYWDTTGTDHWAVWDNPLTPAIDTSFIYYRVPLILPEEDPTEPVKGLIYVKQRPYVKVFDRVRYTIYMYDLAKHKSNTIDSPPIDF